MVKKYYYMLILYGIVYIDMPNFCFISSTTDHRKYGLVSTLLET